MLGIIFGILLGIAFIWILITIWDYMNRVVPININVDNDPIFDEIKCPECHCYEYEELYVDPLFNKGKYARCKACGWTWDLDEDESCGVFERDGNVER